MMPISIRQVKGIGSATEEALAAAGITSVERLSATSLEKLVGVPGFGEARASQVIENARQLMADSAAEHKDEGRTASSGEAGAAEESKNDPPKKKGVKKRKKKDKKQKKEKLKKDKKAKQVKGQKKKKGKKSKKKKKSKK